MTSRRRTRGGEEPTGAKERRDGEVSDYTRACECVHVHNQLSLQQCGSVRLRYVARHGSRGERTWTETVFWRKCDGGRVRLVWDAGRHVLVQRRCHRKVVCVIKALREIILQWREKLINYVHMLLEICHFLDTTGKILSS